MNRVRFFESAKLEVLAEVVYYHRVEAGLGAKFLEAVEDATARALAYQLGRLWKTRPASARMVL